MIQLPYEFGIPEENESSSAQEDFRYSKTPRQQGVESETSFDSGYFSPPVSSRATQGYQRDATLLPVYQQSPAKVGFPSGARVLTNENSPAGFQFDDENDLPADLPAVLDDWDKNFIDNFQENLFGFDNIDDIGFVDSLLKSSPLKSPFKSRFVSPSKWKQYSPQKFQFSPVRVGQLSPMVNKHSNSTNKRWAASQQKSELIPSRSTSQPFCDKDVSRLRSPLKAVQCLSNINIKQEFTMHIKEEPPFNMTSNSVSLFQKNEYFEMDDPNTTAVNQSRVLKSTENYTQIIPRAEVGLPQNTLTQFGAPPSKVSRTEPKRALTQNIEQRPVCASKQKLQMARAHFKISLDRAIRTASARQLASKSDKYPQLSKALTKKSAESGSTSQTSSSESVETTALPFERYKDYDSTAGSGYEVKRKSDCKVVIRKRSK